MISILKSTLKRINLGLLVLLSRGLTAALGSDRSVFQRPGDTGILAAQRVILLCVSKDLLEGQSAFIQTLLPPQRPLMVANTGFLWRGC